MRMKKLPVRGDGIFLNFVLTPHIWYVIFIDAPTYRKYIEQGLDRTPDNLTYCEMGGWYGFDPSETSIDR